MRSFLIWWLKDVLLLVAAVVVSFVATCVIVVGVDGASLLQSSTEVIYVLEDGRTIVADTPEEIAAVQNDQSVKIKTGRVRTDTNWSAWIVPLLLSFHGALLMYVSIRNRRRLGEWFRPTLRAASWGLAGGAFMIALGLGYDGLLNLFGLNMRQFGTEALEQLSLPFLLVFGAGLAPLAEEIYFRGRLHDETDSRLGGRWAAVISAASFGLVHADLLYLPAFICIGLLLVGLRRRTGGLVAPVLAHTVNNAAGLLMLKGAIGH